MGKSKAERLSEVHQNALREFQRIQDGVSNERRQCFEDRRFANIAGAQWEGGLSDQFANKPKLEFNIVHKACQRVTSEYRNNRITVNFAPRKNATDDLADLCDGLYRADEQDSEAREAYDNAFDEAKDGGIGAWRYRADYEDEYDEENDHQRIRIEPIYEADASVFFDLDAQRQDKADAKFCFVVSSITREAYKERYGDDPSDWPEEIRTHEYDWQTPNFVKIVEHYILEETKRELIYFETITGDEFKKWSDEFEDEEHELKELSDAGTIEVSRRKIKTRRCHKYIMSGGKVVEDCGFIAGKHIPIVMIFGERKIIDDTERAFGIVRFAKDPQRLKNMNISRLAEIAALSPIEKPILTPGQIKGNQQMWADDNIENYPYLLINEIEDAEGNLVPAGPVGYTKPVSIPPALAALHEIADVDARDILNASNEGLQGGPEMSGRAVEMIQNRVDMQTFVYLDNLAKGMKRGGEIWLEMAKDLYIEDGRDMKIVSKEGEQKSKKIRDKKLGEDGEMLENDISLASFDVQVEVGPSSSSKRSAIVRTLSEAKMGTQDPEMLGLYENLILMNMEGEGLKPAREYARKRLVRSGVFEPTEDDLQELQEEQANQQPDAQQQYLLAAAQNEQANANSKQVEALETLADTELKKAKTQEILAKIQREGAQAVSSMAKQEQDMILQLLNASLESQQGLQQTTPSMAQALPGEFRQ